MEKDLVHSTVRQQQRWECLYVFASTAYLVFAHQRKNMPEISTVVISFRAKIHQVQRNCFVVAFFHANLG